MQVAKVSFTLLAGETIGSWPPLPDSLNGSINRGSLYHCTLRASKRS